MNKTILITGSTDGIGKLAAIKLAADGHEVYLHGRDPEKLSAVITEVKAATGNDTIGGFVADFADLDAVRSMAVDVNQALTKLDVLINNAGVLKAKRAKTSAGYDLRFAVNYLAPYILTHGLMPLLKQEKGSRVINLSSAAQTPVSLAALDGSQVLSEMEAYSQSKLAITMWSMYLAANEADIVTIPVNPGSLLNTRMVKEGFGFHRSPADKGGDILYDLATDQKYAVASGKYFDNDSGGFGAIHPAGNDGEAIKSLIKKTAELLSV